MYLDFYRLEQLPFGLTPDTRRFYGGGERRAILEGLICALLRGSGICTVIGEVGSGKTMLSRMLSERLPATFQLVYLANPALTPQDIPAALAEELKLPTLADDSHLAVLKRLQHYLLETHAMGRRVVVFVDEAQAMPAPSLEQIRLLTNLETHSDKLLQIVLFGQPELDRLLGQQNLRQLRERIEHRFLLRQLQGKEISEYLHFRLVAAGYRGCHLFGRYSTALIGRYSRGLIRRINLLADKTLLAAYASQSPRPRLRDVRCAAREQGLVGGKGLLCASAMVLAVLLLGGGLWGGSVWRDAGVMLLPLRSWFSSSPLPREQAGPLLAAVTATHRVPPEAPRLPAADAAQSVPLEGVRLPTSDRAQPEALLKQRLAQDRRWILSQSPQDLSVQLLLVPLQQGSRLLADISLLAAPLRPDDVHLYRRQVRGQEMLGALYHVYSSAATAREIVSHLPTRWQQHRPYVSHVKAIQQRLQP